MFDDDPNLKPAERNSMKQRGGSGGIIKLQLRNGILVGERNIILGKNIPNYPKAS